MPTINLSKDGDQWCALLGTNLQEGTAGFGATQSEALSALALKVTVPPLDIDMELDKALTWAASAIACAGCSADLTKREHNPICKVQSLITTSRGANGKVCILNPHPSA